MKYKIEATIPTTQYGNLRPSFDIENGEENEVLDKLKELWDRFGEKPLPDKAVAPVTGQLDLLDTFTGETILWDEHAHKYYSKDGKQLMSGSSYADSVSPKFDRDTLLPKTAKSWGVPEASLGDIWELNGRVSTEYGSAIHTALEIWHKYSGVGANISHTKGLEDNYVLPKNKHIRQIVLDYAEKFAPPNSIAEVLISDVEHGRAGRIDLLEIVDEDNKVCRVGDYKTNNDLDDKKVLKYQHQMSFYAHILMAKGWSVTGLDIFHYDGEVWNKIELPVLELVA